MFNPETTQKVIIATKKELNIFGKAWAIAHRQLAVYYCYLVAMSITLQTSIPDLQDYISEKTRHWIMGVATVIVFADKLRRSAPKFVE